MRTGIHAACNRFHNYYALFDNSGKHHHETTAVVGLNVLSKRPREAAVFVFYVALLQTALKENLVIAVSRLLWQRARRAWTARALYFRLQNRFATDRLKDNSGEYGKSGNLPIVQSPPLE